MGEVELLVLEKFEFQNPFPGELLALFRCTGHLRCHPKAQNRFFYSSKSSTFKILVIGTLMEDANSTYMAKS